MAVLAASSLAACTDGASPTKPSGSSGSSNAPQPHLDVQVYDPPRVAATRLSGVRPTLSGRLEFPPDGADGVTRLLEDPPGRAMVHLVKWIPYDRMDGFSDQVLAVLGVDGRWRLHAMSEFGFGESLTFGADTTWAGSLSPDGRWWLFPLSDGGRPRSGRSWHLLDLATANLREIHSASEEPVGEPVWTSTNRLALDWREGGEQGRRLVDPASGAEVATRGFVGHRRNLIYAPDGQVHQLARRNRELVTYDETLEETGRSEVPFVIPGDRWRPAAAGKRGFAFLREGVGPRRSDVLVTDAALTPTASLQVSARRLPWSLIAWVDAETVVLYPGSVGGKAPAKLPVTVWRPATGEIATIATAIAAADRRDLLIVQICPGALAKPT